ncbi:MAG: monovalent cation/H(+) antiporter subunit G [Rhodospirillaceae bacterium]
MTATDLLAAALAAAGSLFFVAGTLGLIRFPDVYSRLHALTKADNVGLGLIVLATFLREPGIGSGLRLGAIWLLILFASALAGHLIAREALRRGIRPWRRP